MGQVRAKFRCMQVAKTWDRRTLVTLRPVTQSKTNEENTQFWTATPSGEADLAFCGPSFDADGKEYVPGDYYYIDMAPDEDGGYLLSTLTYYDVDTGSVQLCTRGGKYTAPYGKAGFSYGKIDMSIDNPLGFAAFDKPAAPWSVKITWAEGSDD